MRDILVTLIVFGPLPWVLRSPVNGVLMWVWISGCFLLRMASNMFMPQA